MAINDRIVLDIEGNRVPCVIIFEGDYHSKNHYWQDTVAVAKAEGGFVAVCNRLPVTDIVPKNIAIQAMMNHMQNNMQ